MLTSAELKAACGRLEAFLTPILEEMGRKERQDWGAFYVQGLLLEGGRKTAAGIAERCGGNTQAVQQFVNQSPWYPEPVRRSLARSTLGHLSTRCGWIVDETSFPKKGEHSVGVQRQYSGTLGKVANCQIGVSLHYATDEACVPLDFALYLPKGWLLENRRQKAGIPPEVRFTPKWRQALEMIDRARVWGVDPGVVIADAGFGVVGAFREGLRQRGFEYVVGVQSSTGLWLAPVSPGAPAYQGRGRPRTRHYDLPRPQSARQVADSLPSESWQQVNWREGSKGPLESRFAAIPAQPYRGHAHQQVKETMGWLLMEWPRGDEAPAKYWLSNLPPETSLRELVYWAKFRWWIEQNYQQLKQEIGLDHFEGRTWNGWHHHVTLCMMAFNFLMLETLRVKKNFWVDPPQNPQGTSAPSGGLSWYLPSVPEENEGAAKDPNLT